VNSKKGGEGESVNLKSQRKKKKKIESKKKNGGELKRYDGRKFKRRLLTYMGCENGWKDAFEVSEEKKKFEITSKTEGELQEYDFKKRTRGNGRSCFLAQPEAPGERKGPGRKKPEMWSEKTEVVVRSKKGGTSVQKKKGGGRHTNGQKWGVHKEAGGYYWKGRGKCWVRPKKGDRRLN